ncbi:AtpZ/AtpI family protein [Erythrobacteraceae bacterium CFH 75059]|uniref:AtpZ/AtpI family protein n=1 Tax=Qipengyuania thermophila TaxID=2509361 RepID=UPI00101F520C|nr:AtpZ/AtpI family protein [Qipengyuania thermophila]TCD05395.1 AtpZ/AtpI family protein [Erythrobacteraceae bacterium CFH 75059]
MTDDPNAPGSHGEDVRIAALEERLEAARRREGGRTPAHGTATDASYRSGSRVLADLLGGIVGGLVVGGTVDYLAGTGPWGLLIGLFLGVVVAFRNVMRMAARPPE